jgi:hypothetical protein
MAEAMQGLRQLADVLNIETARISGDPQRLQLALGESQSRKLQEANNLINAEIDKLNIPDTQKALLKAIDTKSKADYILGGEKRRIVKGADGFQYYVNPDGSFERVLPGIQPTSASGDLDIFTVVDERGDPIGNIVNPTEQEITKLNEEGKTIERLPTVSQKRELGGVGLVDKSKASVKSRFSAYSNFTNLANKLINEIAENPEGGLAVGSAAAFADRLTSEVQGAADIIARAKETGAYEDDLAKYESKFTASGIATEKQKTIVLNLAYQFAAAKGQEGRGLSDKDFENALRVVGSSGNPQVRIAVLQNIIDDLGGEVKTFFDTEKIDLELQKSLQPNTPGIDSMLELINQYQTLMPSAVTPSFNEQPSTTETASTTPSGKKVIRIKLD